MKPGWITPFTEFALGPYIYRADGSSVPTGLPVGTHLGAIDRADLERWSMQADTFFMPGCEPYAFALLCSFAAPLLPMLGNSPRAVVSLVNRGGQSVALDGVASVWGAMDCQSWPLPTGDLPCSAMNFCNRDPSAVAESIAEHKGLLICEGSKQIVGMLGSRMGRVLEMSIVAPPSGLNETTAVKMKMNRGIAGEEFIRYLVRPEVSDWAVRAMQIWANQTYDMVGKEGSDYSGSELMAAVAVAALIVKKLRIIRFSPQRILDWALERVDASVVF